MKKIGLLLALLALLMAALPGALAETVTYLEANGVEKTTEAIVLDQTWLDKNENLGDDNQTTWYYVPKGTSVEKKNNWITTVYGDVHLILGDGATLKVEGRGIRLTFQASLTIYAQSQSKNMGRLIATVTATGQFERHHAGINVTQSARLTINGGYIEATGGADGGAGIGGNGKEGEHEDCGTVIINGGIVTAQGGAQNGVGIGGGSSNEKSTNIQSNGGRGADLTINGGLVTAIGGGENGKAIGSGHGYDEQTDNGSLTLGDRIAVYDDTKDEQLTGSTDEILNQIIGTFGQKNQIQKVVFETHTGYQIVESDQYVQPTGTLSMTASGEFGDFQYLRLNNKKLDPKAYTTRSGSTVATVDAALLNCSLDTPHTLSFIYPDGSADGQFSVVLQLPAETIKDLPQTGDNSRLLLYVGLALVCGVGVIALLIARKRR